MPSSEQVNPEITKPSLKMLRHPTLYLRQLREYYNQKYYEAMSAQQKDPTQTDIGASSAWTNPFYGFLTGELLFLRTILTQPFMPGLPAIIPPQKDAFWTVDHVVAWLNKMPFWLTYPFKKINEGINWLVHQKSIATALTYIPYIGLGASMVLAVKDFYYEKNKNVYTTLKMLAHVASSILLGVGLGIAQWGAVSAAVYCAPYLIMAAAALVVSVSVVKTFHHIYKAYQDRPNARHHLINACKEFLCTFINAAGFALTLLGMQAGQKLQQFDIKKLNFQVLIDAGAIYKKTVVLTNAVLAVATTLFLMNIASAVYQGFSYIRKKLNQLRGITETPAKTTQPHSVPESEGLISDINTQIRKLEADIAKNSNGTVASTPNDRHVHKKEYLLEINAILQDEVGEDRHGRLVTLEKAKLAQGKRIYQSFFRVVGETERLAGLALSMTNKNPAEIADSIQLNI